MGWTILDLYCWQKLVTTFHQIPVIFPFPCVSLFNFLLLPSIYGDMTSLFITIDTTRSQLVGGFNHLEKYEFANGKDDIPYIMEHHPFMFETTNQTRSEFGCFSSFSVTQPLAFLLNSTNCMDGFRVALLLLDHPFVAIRIGKPKLILGSKTRFWWLQKGGLGILAIGKFHLHQTSLVSICTNL